MGFVSTAIDFLGDAFGGITDTLSGLAPLVNPGLQVAAATGILPQPAGPRIMGPSAMPGGAPIMSQLPTAIPASFGGLVRQIPNVLGGIGGGALGAELFGGGGGAAGCITPVMGGQQMRMPRLVQFQSPLNPNRIETYVRAPVPRYKVSVSGPRRRRCSGGR